MNIKTEVTNSPNRFYDGQNAGTDTSDAIWPIRETTDTPCMI